METVLYIILFAGACLIALSILVAIWNKWWGEVTMIGIGMRLIATGIIGAVIYGLYQAFYN